MRLLSTIILIISLGLASTAAISKNSDKPPIPFEDHGACPFDCCVYREWFARGDIKALKDRKEGSPVVFGIKEGERVTALTGVVITTKPGVAKAIKPIVASS